MVKHCIYCNSMIKEDSVLDVCKRCGYSIWGEKMFQTILENMKNAKDAGNLYQGSISETEKQLRQN